MRPHAADMAAVVSATATLGDVQDRLAAVEPRGQWLPIDGDPEAAVSELVEHDSGGPLRLGYGGWRDRLTGVQLLDGDGNRITAGGLPVKNVAGYDLARFAVGAHGCFGRVETIVVRTALRPEAALHVDLPIAAGELTATVNRLLVSDAPPQWMLCRDGVLRCGWLGDAADLDALAPAIRADVGIAATRQTLDDDDEARAVSRSPARAFVPPARIGGLLEQLTAAHEADLWADPVHGVIYLPGAEAAASLIAEVGGHAVAIADGAVRVWSADKPPSVLMSLKARLDPDAKLPALPTYA